MLSNGLIASTDQLIGTNLRDRTTIRSLRVWSQLDAILREDAKQRGISVNALVNTILRKYVEWDRYVEKYPFSFLPREWLKEILAVVAETDLIRIGQDLGGTLPKDLLAVWFPKVGLDTLVEYAERLSRYAGNGQSEMRIDGNDFTWVYYHDLGQKWSEYQASFRREELRTTLGIAPDVETTKSSVITRFEYQKQT